MLLNTNSIFFVVVAILLFKKHNVYPNEIKKENSSNFFVVIANKDLLYLKIRSPFQHPLQVILYPGKS